MPTAAKPAAARCLRFRDDNGTFLNLVPVRDEPGCKEVCRIDVVKVVKMPANDSRAQARTDQLRQKDIRQTDETISRKQLAANFDSGLTKFIDPTRERGMRDAEVLRQLLAGHRDHHVLHQGEEKLVELAVHGLFGSDAEMNIDRGDRVRERANGDVINAGFSKLANRLERNSSG